MMNPKIKDLQERVAQVDKKLAGNASAVNPATPTPDQVFGAPAARTGENIMSSRGFSFVKMAGLISGQILPENCKIERDLSSRLQKMGSTGGFNQIGGSYMAPLGASLMGDVADQGFRHEVKSLCTAGVDGADPDQIAWQRRKANQSWVDESLGGALVPNAATGELITLLRNKDALLRAGASVMPLPPQGRLQLPRQTTASTGYWIGENAAITSTTIGTGKLTLSAKKVAALLTFPNELIRFGGPAVEALYRNDMATTLSLTFDYACLYGAGSDNVPLGLVNTPGIATVTPGTVAADGNTLAPQDLYKFVSAVEANNGTFSGYVLRPELFNAFVSARAGVYNGSAVVGQGQFVYDQFRELGMGFPKALAGYNATTTSQVSIARVKGNGTTLTTLFGGDWGNAICAFYNSVEFAAATQGDTAFANDQTAIRAILTCDFGVRNPGVFAVADQVLQTISV